MVRILCVSSEAEEKALMAITSKLSDKKRAALEAAAPHSLFIVSWKLSVALNQFSETV